MTENRINYLNAISAPTILTACCLFLTVAAICPASISAAKKVWTEGYSHRLPEDLDSPQLLRLYDGETRSVMSLNGKWQARLAGEKNSHSVWVPGAFDFEGQVRFARNLELDSSFVDKQLKLVLLGVNNRCKIYLNKQFLGSHANGHTAFSVELDEDNLLLPGTNELVIEVDSSLLPRASIPLRHHPGIGQTRGGIIRDILIQVMPPAAITNVHVKYEFSDEFQKCGLTLRSVIRRLDDFAPGPNANLTLQSELWDTTGTQLITRSEPEIVEFDRIIARNLLRLDVQAFQPWTPDHPNLYELRVNLKQGKKVIDVNSDLIGFNVAEVTAGKFLLNGKPFSLRGVNWYAGETGAAGPAANPEILTEIARRIKSLGANAVRVVGTPSHAFLFDVCDRLGLLVFTEVPLSFVPGIEIGNPAFSEIATGYFAETLQQGASHPSLGGVGLGADVQYDSPGGEQLLKALKTAAGEEIDRPLYVSYRNYLPSEMPENVDLTFYDFYNSDDEQIDAARQKWEKLAAHSAYVYTTGFPFRKIGSNDARDGDTQLGSEADFFQSGLQDEELQAYRLNRILTKMNTDSGKAGIFVHTFSDWHEKLPNIILGPSEDDRVHSSGLLAADGNERLAFGVVESVFKEGQAKKMSLKLPVVEKPNAYPVAGIAVVLLFLFNFNRSRRFRENLRRIFLYPHGFYTELRENRKVAKGQTFLLSLIATVVVSIIISSVAFNFRQKLLFDDLLNLFINSTAFKANLIWLAWHPLACVGFLVVLSYLAYAIVISLLKMAALILGERLPVVQFYTLVFWAAACYVWLLPIVPIYYRLISQTEWGGSVILIFALFLVWFLGRFLRGVKVVLGLSVLRATALVLILGLLTVGGLGWYLDKEFAFLDYLPMYWTVLSDKIAL